MSTAEGNSNPISINYGSSDDEVIVLKGKKRKKKAQQQRHQDTNSSLLEQEQEQACQVHRNENGNEDLFSGHAFMSLQRFLDEQPNHHCDRNVKIQNHGHDEIQNTSKLAAKKIQSSVIGNTNYQNGNSNSNDDYSLNSPYNSNDGDRVRERRRGHYANRSNKPLSIMSVQNDSNNNTQLESPHPHHQSFSPSILHVNKQTLSNSRIHHNTSIVNTSQQQNNYNRKKMKQLQQKRRKLMSQTATTNTTSSITSPIYLGQSNNSFHNKMNEGQSKPRINQWGSIQHHNDIRNNFSSSLSNTNRTSTATNLRQNQKQHQDYINFHNSSKKNRNDKSVPQSDNRIGIPTTSRSVIENSSFFKQMSCMKNKTPSWPRWKKNQRNTKQNDISEEDDDGTTTSNKYVFGPQFLSNKKRANPHRKDDIIVVDDDNHDDKGDNGQNELKKFTNSSTYSTKEILPSILMTPRITKGRHSHNDSNNNTTNPPSSTGSDYYATYSNSPCYNSHHRSYTNRKRKRKGTHTTGPLSKMLQSIRNETVSDLVKFQSGAYPYQNEMSHSNRVLLDIDNPRYRAENILDVTVIGYPIPFNANPDKVTILVYLHSYSYKKKNELQKWTSSNACIKTQQSNHTTKNISKPGWICFNYDTINEHRISAGKELRLYNVLMMDGPSQFWDVPIILCTRLCEPCPLKLKCVR